MAEPAPSHAPEAGATRLGAGARRAGYAIGGLFGALGLAVFAMMDGLHAGPVAAGTVLVALGAQAVWAARRGRRSWLTQIGPLP